MSSEHYDVIIIGSGAGGGTLAYRLAPTGLRVLILERGGYVPREKDNWSPRAVNVQAKYHPKTAWHTPDGHPLHPHTNYYVGGNTKFYGAALFRLRREDFGEIRHAGGLSPAWPIGYDDLEPYYTEAERIYHVHGARGEDPTEPRRARRIRIPALPHEPRIQQLHDDLVAHRASAVPRADRRHARRGEPGRRASASAATRATATRACCTPSRTPRSAASSRRCAIPTSRCGPTPTCRASRPTPRDVGCRASSSSATASPSATPATSSSSRAARSTRRRCCSAPPASGTPTAWRTARTSSGVTTWATSTRC